MNILRNLTGRVCKEEANPLPACMAVADEVAPGLIRQARIGIDGIMLTSGRASAFVPFRELFALLERTDGRVDLLFKMPPPPGDGRPRMPGERQTGNDLTSQL
jgi:hypothetical protein